MDYLYDVERTSERTKTKLDNRQLILKPMEGKDPLDSSGMIDKRLFTGENKLHAFMDPVNNLWRMKMDSGVLPPPLRQSFTSFSRLYDAAKTYYEKRNVHIAKVID